MRRKRVWLAALGFSLALGGGWLYFLFAPRIYWSKAVVSHSAPAQSSATSSRQEDESRTRAVITSLSAPHLIERAARKLGLRGSSREIERAHVRRTVFRRTSDDTLEVEVWASSPEVARTWVRTLVEEFGASRKEKLGRDREEALGAYLRASEEARLRVAESVRKGAHRMDDEVLQATLDHLEKLRGLPAEAVHLLKRREELNRVRAQLEDSSLGPAERFALLGPVLEGARQEPGAPVAALPEADDQVRVNEIDAGYEKLLRELQAIDSRLAGFASGTLFTRQFEPETPLIDPAQLRWESLYQQLVQRLAALESSEAAQSFELGSAQLRAVSDKPVSPDPTVVVLLTLIGGSVLALVLPMVVGSGAETIGSVAEAEAMLGIPALGLIPQVIPDMSGAEHFEAIRTRLLAGSDAGKSPQTIIVTSARPREGKTFVAAQLAIACARSGAKTLIVDTDLRSGRVHRFFGYRRTPGLSDVLKGAASLETACRATSHEKLMVLNAGHPVDTPGDLLGSPDLAEVMSQLRERFERIVIDAPAVSSGANSSDFSKAADAAVLVIAADQTRSRDVRAAIAQLASAKITLRGSILNRFDPRSARPLSWRDLEPGISRGAVTPAIDASAAPTLASIAVEAPRSSS